MSSLTPKQQRFCEEYLIDLNATQAAIRAGYSEKTASSQGERLLRNAEIDRVINAGKQSRSERTQIDADWVLQRLALEADADLADLYDAETGDLLPVKDWPKIWRQGLVAGVDIEALYEGHGDDRIQVGHTKKLKLSDRVRRLELIGKHIKVNAFQEQVAVKGLDTLADRLERAMKRGG